MNQPHASAPSPHMTPEQFSAQAEEMVRWIQGYWASLENRPVTPEGEPGCVFDALPPAAPPQTPEPTAEWDAIRDDLDRLITPNLLHWQSPRFFGYFPCNASGPGVLGSLVASALNVNGMLWATSPAATELETKLLDWCAAEFGLDDRFLSTSGKGGGCIQGTASESTLVAMLAGRDRARDAGASGGGMDDLRVYASDQAHSSVVKAAMIAGLARGPEDRSQVRLIPTDANGAMRPEALRDALAADVAAGGVPCSLTATVGTTGTEGLDPLAEIASIVESLPAASRPWLHADLAFTGAAMICPEFRPLAAGLDRFDSLCLNPHKWLLTNFDCDLFWTADHRAITRALSITPEYLRNDATDAGAVFDYRDWQIPLGRSFRALKLWFVLRHYGVEGLRAHIRHHVAMAVGLEGKIRADPRFALVGTRATSLICFRLVAGDDLSERLLRELNAKGRVFLSHTRFPVDGESRFILRIAVGATRTEARHVDEAWAEISAAADRVLGG
ncbi:MAG: aromatic-L-amino-acid decarboxylase [Phycisphaerales bacterium]|jgi:aromatic-L-amino-acid decarboxylase